jgi:malonyl-CoA decarboxylase
MDIISSLHQLAQQVQQFYEHVLQDRLTGLDLPFSFNELAQGVMPDPTSFTAAAVLATRTVHSGLKDAIRIAKGQGAAPTGAFNTLVSQLDQIVADLHPVDRAGIIQVTNQSVSRNFLDQLMQAEEVKAFAGEADLQTRLGTHNPNRAVFALRDPYMDGALISIQVAYAQGLPGDILNVIEAKEQPTGAPDTACFYTVSNWRRMAVPVAKPFILGVVDSIRQARPEIKNFVTLSPMYGFRKWLGMTDEITARNIGAAAVMQTPFADVRQAALAAPTLPALQQEKYYGDLQILAAFYIVSGRKEPGRFTPFNDTAGFHPRNGAFFQRLLPGGDRSEEGFRKSLGFMANYLYVPDQLEANAKAFPQGVIATSPEVRQVLSGRPRPVL